MGGGAGPERNGTRPHLFITSPDKKATVNKGRSWNNVAKPISSLRFQPFNEFQIYIYIYEMKCREDIHFKTQPGPVAKNAAPRPPAGN